MANLHLFGLPDDADLGPPRGAGTALVVALAAVILVLLGAIEPQPGLAAGAAASIYRPATEAFIDASPTVTWTAYLPMLSYVSPIVPNIWKGEYYANTLLSGSPAYETEELSIDYDWGDSSAPSGLPLNYFSARWTGHWNFEAGTYTFFAYADDGMRLWLDDELIIDAWSLGQGDHDATRTIAATGLHKLRLEYFEFEGDAAVQLHWRRTDLFPQWQGEYYNQPWVEYGKMYDRTDSVVQFDWGEGCPHDLPCNSFSVGWEAKPVFEGGTYRIFMYADEGYELYVNGSLREQGGWYDGQDGGSVDAGYVIETSASEQKTITYNFHDRGGPAEARLWIEYMEHPEWNAEYYDNKTLSGDPVVTKQNPWIFYDWKDGKPVGKLPSSNNFSVRWTGQRYFHAGCYRFGIFADDGARLTVDGQLLIDEWHDGWGTHHSPLVYLTTGYHPVTVEYYESSGDAEMRLWWE